jgi:hypothetical protein
VRGFGSKIIRRYMYYYIIDNIVCRVVLLGSEPVSAGLVQCAEEWIWGSAGKQLGLDARPQGLKPSSTQFYVGAAFVYQGEKAPTPLRGERFG